MAWVYEEEFAPLLASVILAVIVSYKLEETGKDTFGCKYQILLIVFHTLIVHSLVFDAELSMSFTSGSSPSSAITVQDNQDCSIE